ncbi:muropeptide transporter [Salinivirga cyanobacteriivorans]|uniref:Muropeptide transporter n=1 Tax=Salinivirga cyanobacteriivorans TaxID=1307839 RepID=A0A0S2I4M6_9BACT|nr:MFS transporter [Salinivirga cyanobacteriivorans]ALO17172.1 muropeptide transporter [Salinivirga cyanobacteriivorans]
MKGQNWHKFPLLFSLYIAQSIPMSFFSTVVPVIMRQENYSLESIGLLQLVKLPWILKFLWAPVIDSKTHNSRQLRRWIIVSEIFYAIVIFGIGWLDLGTSFQLIVILMVIAFTASATQDIATDAFAILILKKNERSLGNSMQSGGSFVGSLMGTGVLLIAYYYFGWQVLLWLLASFVLFALIPLPFYHRKNPVEKPEVKTITPAAIKGFFARKGMHKRVLLLVFYYSGIIGTLAMLKPYMVDLGYTVKEIGFMSGIFGTSIAAAMAFVGGFIQKKIGRRKALYLFASINLITALWFVAISHGTPALAALYLGIGLLWGGYGLSTVVIYTTSMDMVRPGHEGTDFTVQIVITHLSGLIFAVVSGKIGDLLGYTGLFTIEAAFCAIALLTVFYVLNKNQHYAST